MTQSASCEQAAIQQLLDKQAIREAILRYCRGVDRCDPDLISSAYHPDAIDIHGRQRFTGETVGQGIVDLVRSAKVAMNHITNQLITFHGDGTAGCETYFTVWQSAETEGGDRLVVALGRYVDRFERRAGGWKIAHRLVIVELTRVIPPGDLMKPPLGLGSRDRNDPSYAALVP
ncbi:MULTISPECIES: nuclear transport factor 2 family protein [Pseudofrankia]|uniref:nuclear transport factor 2 family protein n=1 Tax=Pseudofrankia TaxID=2994363 RepID=UPI000234DB36|nr:MULTISPECIES: nuclear transport factor 2 family protein [Pseudofrankia]OHV30886.1 gamma-BHC dehydrochlorinase [Pseudofrankia sp. EUN1h]